MKSWVFWVCITVAAYFIYSSWFAPHEADGETAVSLTLQETDPPTKEAEPVDPESEPTRLNVEAEKKPPPPGPGGDPAAKLLRERDDRAVEGKTDAARQVEERILEEHSRSRAALAVLLDRGETSYRRFKNVGRNLDGLAAAQKARQPLTRALLLATGGEREGIREKLRELSDAVVFGGRHVTGADILYTPKRGDNLATLCRKTFRKQGAYTAPGFVVSMNRMKSPRGLRAGEPIRIPVGRTHLIIVKSEYRLYFLINETYVRDFPVGLGREGLTPEASFVIADKMINPDWYPGSGAKIPHGHPDNILGTRWLGFKNTANLRGFGIHGTQDPASVGKDMSSGCIRMHQSDVEQIFDWTPYGARITIRR